MSRHAATAVEVPGAPRRGGRAGVVLRRLLSGGLRALRLLAWLAPAIAAGTPLPGPGEAAAAGCPRFPFDYQVDLDRLTELAHVPPPELIAGIERLGISVLRVPGATPGRPPNPLLATLPAAEPALLARAEFQDSYEGRAIVRGDPCCGLARDTVLIRETATAYTLLHEVVHLLLSYADGAAPRPDVELRFKLAFHRLTLYQRRLYDDPWRLLDARWRRDILAAQQEVAQLLYDRIRIGQGQEAVVEHLLGRCIDERSPYRDDARREQGRRYAVAMIDNAVDVFNALEASVAFCDAAVRDLHAEAAHDAALGRAEAEAFVAAAQALRQAMAATRTEIEALKRFYGAVP